MHRKGVRATVAGADVDVLISTFAPLQYLYYNGEFITTAALPATLVSGVPPTVDNAIARWDGVTGTILQNSLVLISDTAQVTGVTALNGRDIAQWVDGPTVGSTTLAHIAIWSDNTSRLIEDSGLHVNDVARFTAAEAVAGHLVEFGDSTGRVLVDSGVVADHVVTNAGTSTDNAITRWDGTSGKVIQNSAVLIDDIGNVTGVATLNTYNPDNWVRGPASAVDSHVALFNGASGKVLYDSGVTIPAGGWVQGPSSATHNTIACFNGASGKAIYMGGSTVTLSGTSIANVTNIGGKSVANIVTSATSSVSAFEIVLWSGTDGKVITGSGIPWNAVAYIGALFGSDNRLVRTDAGTNNRAVQESVVTLDDSGNLSGVASITMGGTLNSRDPDTFVAGPSGATDNRLARYDGATGYLIQNSAITVDDTGNMSGVQALTAVSINSVVPENHRLRHLPGGADTLIDGSSWATGDLLAYNGSGTQFTRVAQSGLNRAYYTSNVEVSVVATAGHYATGGLAVGEYVVHASIPYALEDGTSGNIILGASWASSTVVAVGISIHGTGAVITSSGGTVSIAKTAVPLVGLLQYSCRINVTTAGGYVAFLQGSTGDNWTLFPGYLNIGTLT